MKIIVNLNKSWLRKRNLPAGFTLLEILLVLLLMGILMTPLVPNFESKTNRVRGQVNRANVQKIEGAAQLYKLDVGVYPASTTDLVEGPEGVTGWRGPYLKEIPLNPYNAEQGYRLDDLGRVK